MSHTTGRVQHTATSPTDHGVTPTAQRLEAERSTVYHYQTLLKNLCDKRDTLDGYLRSLEIQAGQTREPWKRDELGAQISHTKMKLQDSLKDIKAVEKKITEIEQLSKKTARRYKFEEQGVVEGPSSTPILGIPKTIQANEKWVEASNGVQYQAR